MHIRLALASNYNINLLQSDTQQHVASFITTTYSHNLLLCIVNPARITYHSATLIDNLFFNKSPAASGIIYSYICDHLSIFIFLDCLKHINKPNFKHNNNNYIKASKINYKNLRHDLLNTTWPDYSKFNDVNATYDNFLLTL